MNTKEFDQVVTAWLSECGERLRIKQREYAAEKEDRLQAFKAAGVLLSVSPEEALAGMLAKHIVSLYNMCGDVSAGKKFRRGIWQEKIIDAISYLILLAGLITEKEEE